MQLLRHIFPSACGWFTSPHAAAADMAVDVMTKGTVARTALEHIMSGSIEMSPAQKRRQLPVSVDTTCPPAHFVFLVTTDETALVESVTMPPSKEAFDEACRVQRRRRREKPHSAAEEYDPTKAQVWDSSMDLVWSLCQADHGRSGVEYTDDVLPKKALALYLLKPNHFVEFMLASDEQQASWSNDKTLHQGWHGTAPTLLLEIMKHGKLKATRGSGEKDIRRRYGD